MGMNWLFKPTTNIGSRVGKAAGEFFNPSNEVPSRMKGFMQGASEGAGGLIDEASSPFSLMMSLAGAPWLKGAMSGAKRLAGPTMDVIEDLPIRQMTPRMDDVDSLIGDMSRRLAQVPNKRVPVAPANMPAEMVARGGEDLYNANRGMNMARESERLADIAYEGSKVAGRRATSPVGGNVEVLKMMEALDRARGKR